MSSRQRLVNLAIAAVIAVVAVVLIVATGGDDSDTEREATSTPAPAETAAPSGTAAAQDATPSATPKPTEEPVVAIEVRDGEVVGGVADLRFKEGDDIRFTVTADVADEVHVHAYDFMKDVEPGESVSFDFPATITGITEVELEDAGLQIAELRVDP